jgi:glutamate/tyrosine decarboxylase-like PLP-dependent enzyme
MLRSRTTYEPALALAAKKAIGFLNGLERRPVAATADAHILRARLCTPLPAEGMDPEHVIERLASNVEDGLLGSQSGRFFAWVIGGSLPSALAADWLAAAWGQNAALHACSPSAGIVEEAAGAWLQSLLPVRRTSSFALVTGSQMAHVTCLAAARHALLRERGWNVEAQGLREAPELHVVCSKGRHASIDRALRLLGIGTENVTLLDPGEHEGMDAERLDKLLSSRPGVATIVALQAGNIDTGTFEDFRSIVPVARRHGAWVHVDGAFGLWAGVSSRFRHLTAGAEEAHSWTVDGHKWLNVPFDCAYAFVAYPDAHRSAFSMGAPYIAAHASARDQIDWNPEWSRRARGFATYAALLELGRTGLAELVERSCRHAAALVDGIAALPGAEALWRPVLNQGLVRFLDSEPGAGACEADHDRRTSDVVRRVNESGEAFFSATTWRGKRAMRVSVVNWQTSERDVERSIAAVAEALRS